MTKRDISFELISNSKSQIKILYRLLLERSYSISHSTPPSFYQHCQFVESKPYKSWYLVFDDKIAIGSFYIKTDNSIGLNLTKHSQEIVSSILFFIEKNFSPHPPAASSIPPYFYINVASQNTELQKILAEMDIVPIQISYRI